MLPVTGKAGIISAESADFRLCLASSMPHNWSKLECQARIIRPGEAVIKSAASAASRKGFFKL